MDAPSPRAGRQQASSPESILGLNYFENAAEGVLCSSLQLMPDAHPAFRALSDITCLPARPEQPPEP